MLKSLSSESGSISICSEPVADVDADEIVAPFDAVQGLFNLICGVSSSCNFLSAIHAVHHVGPDLTLYPANSEVLTLGLYCACLAYLRYFIVRSGIEMIFAAIDLPLHVVMCDVSNSPIPSFECAFDDALKALVNLPNPPPQSQFQPRPCGS